MFFGRTMTKRTSWFQSLRNTKNRWEICDQKNLWEICDQKDPFEMSHGKFPIEFLSEIIHGKFQIENISLKFSTEKFRQNFSTGCFRRTKNHRFLFPTTIFSTDFCPLETSYQRRIYSVTDRFLPLEKRYFFVVNSWQTYQKSRTEMLLTRDMSHLMIPSGQLEDRELR